MKLTQFKRIRIRPLLVALALVALAPPKVVRADAVTDWNAIASTAIVTNAGQPPQVSALNFAMVQGAVYDSVNAIDRGYEPYLVEPNASPTDSKEAAAATAAFRVLVGFADLPGLFPAQLPTLQPQYDAYIAGLPDNPPGSKGNGVTIGETAARAMLIARQNDGRFGPPPNLLPPAPGIWRPTPPNFANDPAPWIGNVRPFIVPSAEMLRTDGPNALTSDDYAEDVNEVKELGSLTSTTRNGDETDAAIFCLLAGSCPRVVQPVVSRPGRQSKLEYRRKRSPVCDGEPGGSRCLHRLLERQVLLAVLASDHGDPRGRHRWQPGHRGRSNLVAPVRPNDTDLQSAAACHSALPRPSLGSRMQH